LSPVRPGIRRRPWVDSGQPPRVPRGIVTAPLTITIASADWLPFSGAKLRGRAKPRRSPPTEPTTHGFNMDDISYVAAVGASIVAGLILWWACGRYQSRITRALFSVITIFVGFLVYFLVGILFIVMRPGIAHETGLAINHGLKVLTTMLLAVNAAILALRSKAMKKSCSKATRGRRSRTPLEGAR
jgi:hypothetical protein